MYKLLSICFSFLLGFSTFAQSPQKISYQAVIRNSDQSLVAKKQVSMRIYILQGSVTGTPVYVETHNPTTNVNGLISIEIGGGNIVSGNFSNIDWAKGPYFIQTYTDPNGGTTYSITITSQLLSVPYALHSKTAEMVLGGINETDPVFSRSTAKGINSTDTSKWNNKQNRLIVGNNISLVNDTINSNIVEKDPIFEASIASGIRALDTLNWNNKQNKLIPGNNISISNDTIRTNIIEIDPVFNGSLAKSITSLDTMKWNNKQNKLISGNNIRLSGDTISFTGISNRYIGEYYGGGIIFNLWKDAQGVDHGLIVSITDQGQSSWSNVRDVLIGSNAQSKWDGSVNSTSIAIQNGHLTSAAKLCLDYVYNGYDDWYLPSQHVFNLLWTNYYTIQKSLLHITGATQIQDSDYWSSTEADCCAATAFTFLGGGPYNINKGSQRRIRAIRSF
jgi:hypothetical protein